MLNLVFPDLAGDERYNPRCWFGPKGIRMLEVKVLLEPQRIATALNEIENKTNKTKERGIEERGIEERGIVDERRVGHVGRLVGLDEMESRAGVEEGNGKKDKECGGSHAQPPLQHSLLLDPF